MAGNNFTLTARSGWISVPGGNRVFMWGYGAGSGAMQYPGPTLLVKQGDTVSVTLNNALETSVSLVFPGQAGVSAARVDGKTGVGALTLEAGPGGAVRYTFKATEPGTYLYQSGTRPDVQVEMGLVGALIVRPATGGVVAAGRAYNTADAAYDDEDLFLLSELDPATHELVRAGKANEADWAAWEPGAWFINGRCAPDTMADARAGWLPAQPYNCRPMMEPGQRLLLRFIGAGRQQHPFHLSGNHARLIARDGRLLSSGGADADLATGLFTIPTIPGGTADAIFTWSGEGLGWDIYGHQAGEPKAAGEPDADHGKPLPVLLPDERDLQYGDYYGGSPYLGMTGPLPAGAGRLNVAGEYVFPWYSGNVRELTNGGAWPGGMMTMLTVVAPGTLAARTAAGGAK